MKTKTPLVLTTTLALFSTVLLTYAWAPPTSNPYTDSKPAPLNVSITGQAKTGALSASQFYANTSGQGGSAINSYYDIGAGRIAAGKSIYSYDKICAGNSVGDCSGTGGTSLLTTGVKFPDNTVQTTASVWTAYEQTTSNFNQYLTSGIYQDGGSAITGDVPDSSHGWTHLITSRHSNTGNNHQLQIAGTYASNDRLFFRKIADNAPGWNEVATRGTVGSTGLYGLYLSSSNTNGEIWRTLAMDGANSTKSFALHYGGDADNTVRFGRYTDNFGGWESNPFIFDMDAPDSSFFVDSAGATWLKYLNVRPQDGGVEGGEIKLQGTGGHGDIHLDNFAGNVRFHTLQSGKVLEVIGGGLSVSQGMSLCSQNATGCGIRISDDGGFYDYNDGAITLTNGCCGNALRAGSFLYSSDIRLKENITIITSPLEKIKKLNGYSFVWKDNKKKDVGVIAQEVEKVFPELVMNGGDGYKSVEYGNLVAPLIEAIKELSTKLDDLFTKYVDQQKEIDELKKQNEIQKQEIETIKNTLIHMQKT